LAVEHALNDPAKRGAHPAIGEDVKVMGVRLQSRIALTIGCALIGRHLLDLSAYAEMKEIVRARAVAAAQAVSRLPVEVLVNAADEPAYNDLFLTVIGTSAESGDDGEVGRGNRQNGLITPYRPMTMEAVAGKNPVTHVGKLYNLAASRIASALVTELADVTDASCMLVSQIGRPVHDPHVADVRLRHASGSIEPRLRENAAGLVHVALARFGELRDEILRGQISLY
jgi:S-adenosylmethionine synthetase